jgi:hypothetical protein
LEIFDHAETMRRFFKKLVRSYALDALDADPVPHEPAIIDAVCTLATQIGAAQSFAEQALGLGKDVRFNGPEISGAALWAQRAIRAPLHFREKQQEFRYRRFALLDAHDPAQSPQHFLSN